MKIQADAGNWQARGQEFRVGQAVRLIGTGETAEGRVVACYPAIGMVDVQWPHTSNRHPVEDLHIIAPGDDKFVAPMHEDTPGGPGSEAELSQGALQDNWIERGDPHIEDVREVGFSATKVAKAYVKKALYWHARDRQYRPTRKEFDSKQFCCPRKTCDGILRQALYKMENGKRIKLHVCPECLFIIRTQDILVDHCLPPEEDC